MCINTCDSMYADLWNYFLYLVHSFFFFFWSVKLPFFGGPIKLTLRQNEQLTLISSFRCHISIETIEKIKKYTTAQSEFNGNWMNLNVSLSYVITAKAIRGKKHFCFHSFIFFLLHWQMVLWICEHIEPFRKLNIKNSTTCLLFLIR